VCNLGVRPTRGGTERLLEAHLPGWEGNLYEQRICVHFVRRLREERQFPDLETLRRQIARDTAQALRELSGNESGHDVGEGAG
jgi:riboflavin kinase/FMN adenylyltransferase